MSLGETPAMHPTCIRFTIRRLMVVVVFAALLCAWFRIPKSWALTEFAVILIAPLAIALFCILSSEIPRRRLLLATWLASLWPMSVVWSLHAAWAVLYGFLGHPPGPADNGLVNDVLAWSVGFVTLVSLFSPLVGLCLPISASGELPSSGNWWDNLTIPVLLIPFVWFLVGMVLAWDPVDAFWGWLD
ncbi:hypothetical protein P12x_004712 [Tundrisphaera lichenicola]|uniref:hypothetical protein n=1 Tax=Tundrisphaera lichenicola TaxID=2029860 RepID=UPI003EB7C739